MLDTGNCRQRLRRHYEGTLRWPEKLFPAVVRDGDRNGLSSVIPRSQARLLGDLETKYIDVGSIIIDVGGSKYRGHDPTSAHYPRRFGQGIVFVHDND